MIYLKFLLVYNFSVMALCGCAQTRSSDKINFIVPFEHWEECETSKGDCKALYIFRTGLQDSVKLIMPCGGTQTRVDLFEEGKKIP